MKQIAIVAKTREYASYLANDLKVYFEKEAVFRCYLLEEVEALEAIPEEYVLLSNFNIFQAVKRKVREQAKMIIIEATLNKKMVDELRKLPENTRALLVNLDYRYCMEVINLIYSIGMEYLELIPYYPGCEWDESVKVAITTGEAALVPKSISTVIDLGNRSVEPNSIYKVARAIGVEDPFESEAAKRRMEDLVVFNPGLERILGERSYLSVQLNGVLKLMKQGIVITDMAGKIYLANDMAGKMLETRGELLKGFRMTDIFPEFNESSRTAFDETLSERLISVNRREVIATVSDMEVEGERKGYIIVLEYFNKTEDRQHKLRSKIRGYGHKAAYTFDQILGESEAIETAKKIAMRMARSESSICLFGESGTGKELFAQSIHNYSSRKDYLFVAINCSALPENLLESELYGYEEGAFSGAKKGGKIGLFELAHKGTLFLDEIGELPMQMQAKLLRAIEEQKIRKVGGKDLIDVDVRIICATNRNLQRMVEKGTFRRDLYYRICVLPIYIPPLRQREEDVFLLMHEMKAAIGADFRLTERAEKKLRSYDWPGNVREVKNITEYLANLGKPWVDAEDVPFFFGTAPLSLDDYATQPPELEPCTLPKNMAEEELYLFILTEIEECQRKQMHIGRKALLQRARARGLFATEQEIRRCLCALNEKGYIVSYKGRRGSLLTDRGQELLMKNRK